MVESLVANTQAELAATLAVSVRTVQSWALNGMPGQKGRYVIAEVVTWRKKRDEENQRESSTFEQVELEHAKVKLARDQLKLQREEGSLVERSVVDAEFSARVLELTTNLRGMCNGLAPDLSPAMDPRDVEAILEKAVHSFLEQYSRPLPEELIHPEDEVEEEEPAPKKKRAKKKSAKKRARRTADRSVD